MPAARSASTSSPPRPNTNGSPPFRRTTRLPRRAARIMSAWIVSCRIDGRKARLPDREALGVLREREHLGRHERVVEHEFGLLELAHRADGEQVRIARARADEDDAAGHDRAASA
jgi:hypothetical protein